MSVSEASRIGALMAEGLDSLHEAGIMHLDIKPANVLLDAHGDVVLAGFSTSRYMQSTLPARQPSLGMCGSANYMCARGRLMSIIGTSSCCRPNVNMPLRAGTDAQRRCPVGFLAGGDRHQHQAQNIDCMTSVHDISPCDMICCCQVPRSIWIRGEWHQGAGRHMVFGSDHGAHAHRPASLSTPDHPSDPQKAAGAGAPIMAC